MSIILVTGAGGFIGGHLVKKLSESYQVRAFDKKPLSSWYQVHENVENVVGDLTDYNVVFSATQNVSEVYHLACDMGGMGFIEHNKTLCMLSIIPDVNTIKAAYENGVKKFLYASTACVYPVYKQTTTTPEPLIEGTEYPADPEDGYGWEKLFMERMCQHFHEDFHLDIRIVRYHNVYGPQGTWQGGREKAPAALCRKVIESLHNDTHTIEIWGDGEQTRSFMFIDDAVEGTIRVMDSDCATPLNLGSDKMVSINDMIGILEKIANVTLHKNYITGPLGVRGRNSHNEKIMKELRWSPSISLEDGLRKTFTWISHQYELHHRSNEQQ